MKSSNVILLYLVLIIGTGCGEANVDDTATNQIMAFSVEGRIGQPAIADGVVYVGSEAGILHAVEMETGRELWRFETDRPVYHPPVVNEDLILFGSWDGRLRAVNRMNGELIWEFKAGRVDWEVRDIFINGTPNVIDGVAYFSSEDFNLYAVEVESGREVWRHTLGEEPQARQIPIIDRTAYIGAWDGHLYAIDIDTGERIWRSNTDDRDRASLPDQVPFVTVVPIVTEEAVYFTDWAGNLFAVDRANGQQVWRFDPGAADSRHVGSRSYMALVGDVLYYSTLEDQHLYGVDRQSGLEVWSTETEGIVYGPVSVEGAICLYLEVLANEPGENRSAFMRAMDMNTRQVLWSTEDAVSGVTLVDGVVYYGGTDGTVHGRELFSGDEVFRLGQ
ncbi:MAG: PQQ-like beta-propeller repeat protein [Rhodothermales bacterium]|nr:PQQ-like beta-propeller repeat protein [Rhodothermales bacterium]